MADDGLTMLRLNTLRKPHLTHFLLAMVLLLFPSAGELPDGSTLPLTGELPTPQEAQLLAREV